MAPVIFCLYGLYNKYLRYNRVRYFTQTQWKALHIDPHGTFSELNSDGLFEIDAFVSKRPPRVFGFRPSET
jgi:hypothetical protein